MRRKKTNLSILPAFQCEFCNYTWREHYGLKNLSRHARGECVRNLQRDLVAAGYPTKIDGYFGASTQSALIDFQFDHGLQENGIADLRTKEELISYCTCL